MGIDFRADLYGPSGRMRGDCDILHAQQRVIEFDWFNLGDVYAGAKEKVLLRGSD